LLRSLAADAVDLEDAAEELLLCEDKSEDDTSDETEEIAEEAEENDDKSATVLKKSLTSPMAQGDLFQRYMVVDKTAMPKNTEKNVRNRFPFKFALEFLRLSFIFASYSI
jgi:TATA-binding protein-associated factor Taf7